MDEIVISRPSDSDSIDLGVRDTLRVLYPQPAALGGEFWDSLEARIMARVSGDRSLDPVRFWSVLERWSRVGIAAALLAVAGSAAFLTSQRVDESLIAYENFTDSSTAEALIAPFELTTQRDPSAQREAVYRFVLSQ